MQQGVQTDTAYNIQQCWEMMANYVASVFTGLQPAWQASEWLREEEKRKRDFSPAPLRFLRLPLSLGFMRW